MKIAYFPNQTALKSELVWRAFLEGMKLCGYEPSENDYDADTVVIWSVLWSGRMLANQKIREHYLSQGKPVFIIEVGALNRGVTWKVAVNNITAAGLYANKSELDLDRAKKLGIELAPNIIKRSQAILLAGQHQSSLQWQGQPALNQWVRDKISEIRKFTDRPIVVRPHPRCHIEKIFENGIVTESPIKLPNTYDRFDIDFKYHCIINHNSGPGIQSAISGCPIIVDQTSLAYPVSTTIEQIETPNLPDRHQWFIEILHTEWTIEEIAHGIPQKRLLRELTF